MSFVKDKDISKFLPDVVSLEKISCPLRVDISVLIGRHVDLFFFPLDSRYLVVFFSFWLRICRRETVLSLFTKIASFLPNNENRRDISEILFINFRYSY